MSRESVYESVVRMWLAPIHRPWKRGLATDKEDYIRHTSLGSSWIYSESVEAHHGQKSSNLCGFAEIMEVPSSADHNSGCEK